MIEIRGLLKAFGDRVLFRDASMRIGPRDRIALVGPNGSGKTTLLEMISGDQRPDGGAVSKPPSVSLGYLPQETDALRGSTILEEVLAAAPAHAGAGHRLEILEQELESCPDDAERTALLAEYAGLQQRFDELGGWTAEVEAKRILEGLGFSAADHRRPTETLSGGWLMRVALAKLLLQSPDALLLDEPTNHLDLESVRWLEGFLAAYEGAMLLVSHDRDFMNGIASKVVEIDGADLLSYQGNYERFVQQREERMMLQAAAAKNQTKRIAQTETFINRFRYKASKARQVQSRIKMLEKMERIEAPGPQRRAMRVGFPPPPRSGRVVISLEDLRFGYEETKSVYEGLELELERGEKVALVGPNGAGKTTLLKLLAGALTPQAGVRRLGHNVAVGYFAQHAIEALDPGNRVIEELQRAIPPSADVRARDLLGSFLFSGDDIDKPVRVLSGGERTRLALAKLLVSPVNLLCLDEPTNHLDIQSRDVLEDALIDYRGTIALITHDRHLIRSVANRIVEVTAGHIRSFPGDWDAYLYHLGQQQASEAPAAEQAPESTKRNQPPPAKRTREDKAAARKLRADIRRVESDLEQTHEELRRLEALLADPATYMSKDRAGAAREYELIRERVKDLEREWERLTDALVDQDQPAP